MHIHLYIEGSNKQLFILMLLEVFNLRKKD